MVINLQFGRVWWGFGREKKQGRRGVKLSWDSTSPFSFWAENEEEERRWVSLISM